jgi:hypothetical protein
MNGGGNITEKMYFTGHRKEEELEGVLGLHISGKQILISSFGRWRLGEKIVLEVEVGNP